MGNLAIIDRSLEGNLILIGFMGTGKSSVGRRVAQDLGYQFVDTDEEIERRAGKLIKDIFAESGEAAFRALETQVLRDYCAQSGYVISTGGGIVVADANKSIMHQGGRVIWLTASPQVIYERVRRNRDRPLLETSNPRSTIVELLNARAPLYSDCSNLNISTDDLSLEETTYGVTETAQYWQLEGVLPLGTDVKGDEE